MKRNTVKFRITVWITLLTALLSILMIGFMLFISSSVVERSAQKQLWQTLRNNASYISATENGIELSDEFHFNQNGVYLLIYNDEKALLAGQIPVSFDVQEEFKSRDIRTVSSKDAEFFVLDLQLPLNWNESLWIRGIMETPNNMAAAQNFLQISMLAMPIFIFMAALGTFYILNRAFRPLDGVIYTAASINEAKDLSKRIDIPKGKDEFSTLAKVFNRLFNRLERSFEIEKQFISDASHELRTPISIIKSACDYSAKYDGTVDEFKESIGMIQRQTDKMSAMVTQLLSMSRIEQGTENINMEVIDLGEFVEQFCVEQKYNHIDISVDKQVFVLADKMLITRILQNLIDNAYKYGKENGHIWISVKRDKTNANISVRDDGIGILPEHQQKIWQRFYQVDPSRNEENGAGLGLSMVQKIAEIHGGMVSLESEYGKGSCFTVLIPIIKQQ